MSTKKNVFYFFVTIVIISLFLRFWNLNFGLPHTFYADEPEFVEFAISYTFQIKDILLNNNWYKLTPVSYVYGTFPIYFYTLNTILFTQTMNILSISYDKTSIYVFLRSINVLISLILIPFTYLLYSKIFKDKLGACISALLVGLNWKLVVHSHYVNADIFITILLTFSTFLILSYYYNHNNLKLQKVSLTLSAIFIGLAAGTKITSLLTIPLLLFLILKKKDIIGFIAFILITVTSYLITNPFSLIFFEDFTNRVTSMSTKEAGLVFDSADLNPFKFVIGLSDIVTLPIFLISIFGMIMAIKKRDLRVINFILIGYILIYLLFFSLQLRRVDRWLLPTVPIVLIYGSYGLAFLVKKLLNFKTVITAKILILLSLTITLSYYVYFDIVLIQQFQRNTPKSESYIWMKENINTEYPPKSTLVYTEEGLDPLNKLPNSVVYHYPVYENEGAALFYPQDPTLFDYIILSSRPMENHKRPAVKEKYPEYYEKWRNFMYEIDNSNKFKMIKIFNTTNPNLAPFSEIKIYQNIMSK